MNEIKKETERKIFRVQGYNHSGFNSGKNGGELEELCIASQQIQINTSCIYETNLDTLNFQVNEIL